jgi:hypothetical protein
VSKPSRHDEIVSEISARPETLQPVPREEWTIRALSQEEVRNAAVIFIGIPLSFYREHAQYIPSTSEEIATRLQQSYGFCGQVIIVPTEKGAQLPVAMKEEA